jgi:ribonuclease HI
MLNPTAPHFLLLTQAHDDDPDRGRSNSHPSGGAWGFVLENIGTEEKIEVRETEPGVWGERLQLLAVVRGLEALEQPSRVTLITPSRFVGNGIRQNLTHWRDCGWMWEKFGEMIPINHRDLWKRIDQARNFHSIDCRVWDYHLGQLPRSTGSPLRSQPSPTSSQSQLIPPAARNPQPVRPKQNNKITFEELQAAAARSWDPPTESCGIPIKPIGHGRAFGLCLS